MDNINLLVAAILLLLIAFILFRRTSKYDFIVCLITKDKRTYIRKKRRRHNRLMIKLHKMHKKACEMEALADIYERQAMARMAIVKAKLKENRIKEDYYISRIMLKEAKKQNNPVYGFINSFKSAMPKPNYKNRKSKIGVI